MSTRVVVKNLPKHITEDRLRSHFEQRGQISDLKIARTQDGRSRRFAYIGFVSEKQVFDVVKYFNNTFIDTSKITVEIARAKGDPLLPRPWSKYSTGSSAHQDRVDGGNRENATETDGSNGKRQTDTVAAKEAIEKKRQILMRIYNDKDDAELQMYLDAMRTKSQVKTWENEGLTTVSNSAPQTKGKQKKEPKVKIDSVIDKSSSGKGTPLARAHVVFEGDDSDSEEYEDMQFGKNNPAPIEQESTDCEVEMAESEENIGELDESGDTNATSDVKSQVPENLIAENGRLFVRNLSYDCTEKELETLFSQFGPIASVHISISRETKRSKGFAFILFVFPEHAVEAFLKLDRSIFQGRLLHILPAQDEIKVEEETHDSTDQSFKSKKEAKLKQTAASQHNWNSLFLNPTAIVDAIAKELGLSKREILNPEAESLATRIALAETKIIHQTKSYLEEEGVVFDSFNGTKERSDSVILVKNIPFDSSVSELSNVFARFGSIVRIILPPTKTIAIVEFTTGQEAKNAFRNVAYSKFKSVPLYLEWAPVGILKAKPVPVESVSKDAITEPSSPLPHFSVYVKNLSFNTTKSDLEALFGSLPDVLSVKIAMKNDPKNPGKKLSMGFGFVEFQNADSAKRAIDSMQNVLLDGHSLQLKLSNSNQQTQKTNNSTSTTSIATPGTKLLIRNIPFEATLQEVKTLFRSFAQIKKVRLPKKFDGNHRGFGFIEFLSKTDASNAFEMLQHTHLYGRHLVIEWANEESSVEQLRSKTKRQLTAMENAAITTASKRKLGNEIVEESSEKEEELESEYFA